ncbi:MAG: thioredoxin family protein [Spirochaetales bacterium]|nr:thioredoxin family protein [Spirochaetales bacterium]
MKTLEHIHTIINEHKLVFMSLSKKDCAICQTLKPKVEHLLADFSDLKAIAVDLDLIPDAIKEYSITNLPTLLIYAMGKEVYRKDRAHNPMELKETIEKYHKILFS